MGLNLAKDSTEASYLKQYQIKQQIKTQSYGEVVIMENIQTKETVVIKE